MDRDRPAPDGGGTASPDDPSLADYWATRRRRGTPPVGKTMLRLLKTQQGRCSICRGLLLHADHEPQSPQEWEQWLTATRKAIRKHAVTVWGAGTPDERVADRLVHAHCQRQFTGDGKGAALLSVCLSVSLWGLLEPVAWKAGTAGS
ncbi:hypothetical protein JOF56_000894 [Kibdelosporangium banguiense]|uniref:PH domain-containing protein n=1 Tax=Kibdelosporangium banguiense TaxID=1365924 RepID=A0ABS4T7W1_9PSEU|nr:hypothetical protein [Kibdelosporangium banguiense]MBP2320509.1 hypothetical protein [Kibdelosporangium banguiense]